MPVQRCYPTGVSKPLRLAGIAMAILGVILLFVCVPYWAWLALLGVGLLAVGLILIKLSGAGR